MSCSGKLWQCTVTNMLSASSPTTRLSINIKRPTQNVITVLNKEGYTITEAVTLLIKLGFWVWQTKKDGCDILVRSKNGHTEQVRWEF